MNRKFAILYVIIWTLVAGIDCEDCMPSPMVSTSEVHPEDTTILRCSMSSAICINDIIAMKYQKKPENGSIWKDAYILYYNETEDFRTLDYGYTLVGRTSPSVLVGEFDLHIVTTELEDSGLWRCVYWSHEKMFESTSIALKVTGQCSIEIHKTDGMEYVLGLPYNYTCSCKRTFPRIDMVNWIINDREHVEMAITELKGYLWNVHSTYLWQATNLDEVPVTCKIVKDTGNLHWTSAITHTPNFIMWTATEACIPQLMISESEVRPKTSSTLRCSIPVDACFKYIIAIKYQKKPVESDIWRDAYIRFIDGTEDFRILDHGYTLAGRTKKNPLLGEYDLNIVTTELEDSGQWRCVYWSPNGKSESTSVSLEVTGPCSIELRKSGGTAYVLGTPYNFTCACNQTYPRIRRVKWIAGGTDWTENATTEFHGFVWDIESTITWQAANSSEATVTCSIPTNAPGCGHVVATGKRRFIVVFTLSQHGRDQVCLLG